MVAFEALGLTGAWPEQDWPLACLELACAIRSAREHAAWRRLGTYRSVSAPYIVGQPRPRIMAYGFWADRAR